MHCTIHILMTKSEICEERDTNLSCPTSQSEDNSSEGSSSCSVTLIKTTNNEVNSFSEEPVPV